MELMRKVTPAFLAAGINLKKIDTEIYLGRIYGVATGMEQITTQYGEAEKFVGEFVATKADGETGMASVCYLPQTVSTMLADMLRDRGEDLQGVKFGFDIFAEPSEKSATGYTWKIKPLMEVKPTESVLAFASSFPALPFTKAQGGNESVTKPDAEGDFEAEGKHKRKSK
jgi:hypothetical protein